MKKQKKIDQNIDRIKNYSEYISDGIEEVGREQNLNVNVTQIVSQAKGKMPEAVFLLQEFCFKMSQKKYQVTVYQVLFHFFALSKYENFIGIDVNSISENLGISNSSVLRATKILESENMIVKIQNPTDKRRNDYFINPMMSWKGKTLNRDKFIEKAKKNKVQLELFPKKEDEIAFLDISRYKCSGVDDILKELDNIPNTNKKALKR